MPQVFSRTSCLLHSVNVTEQQDIKYASVRTSPPKKVNISSHINLKSTLDVKSSTIKNERRNFIHPMLEPIPKLEIYSTAMSYFLKI